MIELLSEVLSGERVNLYGDVDLQMSMDGNNEAVMCLHQGADTVALDAHQLAHLARVLRAMITHGGNLNDHVAAPHVGGV